MRLAVWPATVTGLAVARPAPSLHRGDATGIALATALKARRFAQHHKYKAGQASSLADPWQALRGKLLRNFT